MNTTTSDSSNPSPTPQVDIIRNGELYKQFTNKKPNESLNEENLKSVPKTSTLATELFHAISTTNEVNKQSEVEVDDDSTSMNEGSDKKRGVKRTKSSFKGVFKCGKKFKAQIQTHGVQHYLGLFDSEEEAARAYDSHARLVLGMKAKTNFPFDPSENSPEQNLLQPKIFEENVNKDSNKQPIGKRSYVGMKVRKKTVQDMLEANHKSAFINFPRPLSFIHPNFPRPLGHSLMHVPLQLSQAPHLLSNIPAGYAPVLHSMRFVSNPTFLNPTFPSTATNKSHNNPTTNATSNIDWSKQSYYPLDIPESNQPENAGVEPDWRDQIYYWTGKFTFDESSKLFLWKGKWLGSFTGKPSMAELEASQNDFVYHSLRPISKPITRTKSGNIIPLSGSFDGTYHMENEEESEDYQDTEFFIDFEEYNGNYLAFGKGDSEFGSFVTFGKYDPISSTLEMNRQFVADSDIRSSMSLQQLKELFKQSISQV